MVDSFPVVGSIQLDLRILGLMGNSLEGSFGAAIGLADSALAFAAGRGGIIAAGTRSLRVEDVGSWLELAGLLGLGQERLGFEGLVATGVASSELGLEECARSDEDAPAGVGHKLGPESLAVLELFVALAVPGLLAVVLVRIVALVVLAALG